MRWEYYWFRGNEDVSDQTEANLEKLGSEGWELVSVVYRDTWLYYFLKRPLDEVTRLSNQRKPFR